MQSSKSQRLDTSRERDSLMMFGHGKSKSLNFGNRAKTLKKKYVSLMTKQITVMDGSKRITKSLSTHDIFTNRFMDFLYQKKRNLLSLNEFQFGMINDKSTDYEEHLVLLSIRKMKMFKNWLNQFISAFRLKILTLLSWIPLLSPNNKYKVLWDVIAIVARLYFLYLIPIELGWTKVQILFVQYYTASVVMLLIILADLLIGFNTAYYDAGTLEKQRAKIFVKNIFRSYGLEWISVFILIGAFVLNRNSSYLINVNQYPAYLTLLLFLVHHRNVHEISIQHEQSLNLQKKASSYLELIKFLLFIFYMIHVFACLWFWAGEYSESHEERDDANWFNNVIINNYSWNTQYLTAFYYSSVTMFTVGYGDITPKSDLERTISVIFIMVSSIQLPYSINTVGNIIQQISVYGEERKIKLRTINNYMSRRNVPSELQFEVRQYLDHYWQKQNNEGSEDEKQVIGQLSENLRQKLLINANQAMLTKTRLFRKHFSEEFKRDLLTKITQQVIPPEQTIDLSTAKSDENINFYFIEEGEANVSIYDNGDQYMYTVKADQTLGLYSFLTGIQALEKLRSVGFVKTLVLKRSDFLSVLRDHPTDYQNFCKLRDDMIFNQDPSLGDTICYSCGSNFHRIVSCPMLHYVPQKEVVIKRHLYCNNQARCKFKRKNSNKVARFYSPFMIDFWKQHHEHLRCFFTPNLELDDDKDSISVPRIKTQLARFHDQASQNFQQSQQLRKDLMGLQLQKSIMVSQSKPGPLQMQKSIMFQPQRSMQIRKSVLIKSQMNQPASRANAVLHNNLYQQHQGSDEEDSVIEGPQPIEIKDLIKHRYKLMEKEKYPFQKDKELISYLYLKVKNCQSYTKKGLENFEQRAEYDIYHPHSNCRIIIGKVYAKLRMKRFSEQLSRYLPYMMYPGQFITHFDILGRKKLNRLDAQDDVKYEP